MRSLLTGRMRVLEQSPDGLLHDAQPPAAVGVAAAQLGRDGRPLIEPGAFFVDGSYAVRINSWNSLAGVVVTVRARFLNSDGRLINQEWQHTPNSNRTKATSDFPLGVGFPLNVTAFASAGAPLIGQTFLQVQLISGLGGATLPIATLLQDYVTSVQALAFPGSPIRPSIQASGLPRVVSGTAPGGGVDITETVPTGARWKLISFLATLTANPTVVNRLITLFFANAGLNYAFAIVAQQVTAGQVAQLGWGQGLIFLQDASVPRIETPIALGVTLLAGGTIKTLTSNLQAGDQWGQPQYLVEEFIEAAA